jgi:phasin
MTDRFSPEAMSQTMRSAAETTLTKAQEAVDQYMKEASRVFATVEATADATRTGAHDLTKKAVGHAEANIAAAFDLAKQLLKARDPQEFFKLQQSFARKQAESLGAQMREMGSAVANAATSAAAKDKK